jgi:hypothetical protein
MGCKGDVINKMKWQCQKGAKLEFVDRVLLICNKKPVCKIAKVSNIVPKRNKKHAIYSCTTKEIK